MKRVLSFCAIVAALTVLMAQVRVSVPTPQVVNPFIKLGGTTSAFSGIKRNGVNVEVKLADDSAFTGFLVASLGMNNTIPSVPAVISFASYTAATLPGSPQNGWFLYCSDCTIANPCAGSGTGAFAKRLNGVWVCN